MKHLAVGVSLAVLAGCGGSSDLGYQQAADAANAMEAQARALGVNSPCVQASQCQNLVFASPSICPALSYQPYSTVAPSAAAASAAAAQQRALAAQATTLVSAGRACAAMVNPAPTLACVAAKCQAL